LSQLFKETEMLLRLSFEETSIGIIHPYHCQEVAKRAIWSSTSSLPSATTIPTIPSKCNAVEGRIK
jgi:hypothetical protein